MLGHRIAFLGHRIAFLGHHIVILGLVPRISIPAINAIAPTHSHKNSQLAANVLLN